MFYFSLACAVKQKTEKIQLYLHWLTFCCLMLKREIHYVKLILGYLKDNNIATHSVDSEIFYALIHLQLHV